MPNFLILLALCQALPSSSQNVLIHVSPAGTPQPVLDALVVGTLTEAQTALRATLTNYSARVNITITLAPGVHRVPLGGLLLTSQDSPAPGFMVSWHGRQGETVVSGGWNVTGWTPLNDPTLPPGVYQAPIPAGLGNATSRQLYVDGQRAKRTSRLVSDALPSLTLEDRADCQACSYSTPTPAPLHWANPSQVEFVYTGVGSGWSDSRCAVQEVSPNAPASYPNCSLLPSSPTPGDCGFPYSKESDCLNNRTAEHPDGCCWHEGGLPPSGHWCVTPVYPPPPPSPSSRITMKQPCMWNLVHRPWQPIGGSPPITVENVRGDLSTPGQWYLDSEAGVILYFPLPSQANLSQVTVVVAGEGTLVGVMGKGAARQSFVGLTFSFATWLRPGEGEGFVDSQSSACNVCPYGVTNSYLCGGEDTYAVTPGSVAVVGGEEVDFTYCTFAHLGAYGASVGGGSHFVSFHGCLFTDLSGGAVMLGDTTSFNITDVSLWDSNLTVADCTAVGTGVEFTGSTTIFAAYVADTTITNNLIVNASYSAMTIGWGWGREASRHGGNKVVGNKVLGAQTARCCDGGGLYTLGPQPGSLLAYNYLAQGQAAGAWGPSAGNGIYHDNGSGGFTDKNNVIDGTWGRYLFQDNSLGPYGPGALCPGRDGQQADCGMAFVGNWVRTSGGGTTNHQNTTYANNTFIAPGDPLPPEAAAVVQAAGPRY